jgi:serine/threonine protein kinase
VVFKCPTIIINSDLIFIII